ncbi:hypothetical protein GCM10023191_092370 [Actinoallomurus oryzae]|uniref:Uncharacterized protein n=1 Tax=Actinoallomurus oryzae TaxID=502180 RepID=A0ABP8R4Y8_9ACTN
MTIVSNTPTRAGARVGAALATAVFAVPFALGWIAGAIVYASTWLYAALLAGYRTAEGRGAGSTRLTRENVHPQPRGHFSPPAAGGWGADAVDH